MYARVSNYGAIARCAFTTVWMHAPIALKLASNTAAFATADEDKAPIRRIPYLAPSTSVITRGVCKLRHRKHYQA